MNVNYKNHDHLIGSWKWGKTKFLKQSISKMDAKYKTPKSENFMSSIEITDKGELLTYVNSSPQRKYRIVNYHCYIDDTNTFVIHNCLTLKRFLKNIQIDFQQSEDTERFSAMHFFPFNKKTGASYNWFERKSD